MGNHNYLLPRGAKLKFLGHNDDQVNWRGNAETRGVLEPGAIYTVERSDIGEWHGSVWLVGIDSKRGFNTVMFERVG